MKTLENGRFSIKCGMNMREGVFASETGDNVEITVWCRDAAVCKLCLYCGKKLLYKIPMHSMEAKGAADLFSLRMEGDGLTDFLSRCEYAFEADKRVVNDPYMRATAGRSRFGRKNARLRGGFCFDRFDWGGEKRKSISYEDMIIYQCHLRGYTKHSSSKVKHPGTFAGFAEKISYLKKLGVNTVLFLPIYDFNEQMGENEKKINYWGYTGDACYFAPKASYAFNAEQAATELKEMIKKMHKNGMNLLLDMHFEGKSPEFIVRCLKYYASEYHVDGFLVNTDVVNKTWIDEDPVLRRCKFLGSNWNGAGMVQGQKKFAQFNDAFLTVARRFLKSDEGQASDFFRLFTEDEQERGIVHYITQKNGFTLRDMVSYDVKHNEANGERNLDGTEYNYSWNCGQEGNSRRKAVNAMRLQQMKNAFCMLLLGPATPMILAGDEFGRTQKGNNNAYCQDNATTWMDWNLLEKNKNIFSFTKMLIELRKKCPLYKRSGTLSGIDTLGAGAPGVSGHGIEPWVANFSYYSREVGVLFYGTYYGGKSLYIVFNFHWDPHEFYLPAVDGAKTWNVVVDTGLSEGSQAKRGLKKYVVSPRTIVVFEGETSGKVQSFSKA